MTQEKYEWLRQEVFRLWRAVELLGTMVVALAAALVVVLLFRS